MKAVSIVGRLAPTAGLGWLLAAASLLLAWRLWALPRLGITLYVDEAQYWTWAQSLDWGYFSKPPGIAALIASSTALFGNGLLGVKALAMLSYPAIGLLTWAVARRLYDAPTALWSALAMLTLPIFAWLGLFVSTDAPLTLCWMAGLWAYLRALDSDRLGDWLLVGLIAGLGMLSKYTMLAWLGAAFLHLLIFHRQRLLSPRPWLAAGLALLVLAPNLYWNVVHDFPTLRHTADITLNRRSTGGLRALAEFWGAQWLSFGPVFGSIFLLILLRSQARLERNTRLLLWFSLPLWLLVSVQAASSNANANWAAPAFAPATIAVVAWLLQHHRQRLLILALALNLAISATLYHWPALIALLRTEPVQATVNPKNPEKFNPFRRALGWDKIGEQLRPLLVAHPGTVLIAENRTMFAHMSYELRDLKPAIVIWNPGRLRDDHYKLTTSMAPWLGKDAILVTQSAPGDEYSKRYRSQEMLTTLRTPLDAIATRDVDVYLLREFQGY